jgi:hypothetical protein
MLNTVVERQFNLIYNKLSNEEKKFFNEKCLMNFQINWIFNVNSVYTNRGDICSSSLQKFFHLIFKELPESETEKSELKKDELIKFKNTFIELFSINFLLALNGEYTDSKLYDYLGKFEIKNGFLNVFLKPQGRELLDSTIDKKKTKQDLNENQFLVISKK